MSTDAEIVLAAGRGERSILEWSDDELDRIAAQAMDEIASDRGMHALDLNPNVTDHHALRRALVKAGISDGLKQVLAATALSAQGKEKVDERSSFEAWHESQWPLTHARWKADELQHAHDPDIVTEEDIEDMFLAYSAALKQSLAQLAQEEMVPKWALDSQIEISNQLRKQLESHGGTTVSPAPLKDIQGLQDFQEAMQDSIMELVDKRKSGLYAKPIVESVAQPVKPHIPDMSPEWCAKMAKLEEGVEDFAAGGQKPAQERPTAWYRGVASHSGHHEPPEWDVDMSYGEDRPEGAGWIPLFRAAQAAVPEGLKEKIHQDIAFLEPMGTSQANAMIGALKQVLSYFDLVSLNAAP